MKTDPFAIPASGVIVSFAGWVTAGSSLNFGFASARVKSASMPSTVTSSIASSFWKSRLNFERSCVAFALIVARVPSWKRLVAGS